MRKTNTLFKSFSFVMIAILLVVSLIITASQTINVHAETAHTHSEECHHDVEVGEFEGVVIAEDDADDADKGDGGGTPAPATGNPDPSSCTKCGCKVYACSQCWKEEANKNASGQRVYTNKCAVATGSKCPLDITGQSWYTSLMRIVDIVDGLLNPILVIGGTAGMIFVIILGVNFSKAESADKREEAKKRMINAIIGVVITLLALILVKLFTANADEIVSWINRSGNL